MTIYVDDRDSLLIWLYLEISNLFGQSELPLYTARFSNNSVPVFTDAELFTCAVFAQVVGCRNKKDGYRYIRSHYAQWFPELPCYEVYNRKLNRFTEAMKYIYQSIARKYGQANGHYAMIDTEPIEVCQSQHSRHSKAAQPFVSKGYCAAKKKYYIGAKLQIVAMARRNKLPFPFEFALASASIHDLEIAKETLPISEYRNTNLYGDLAYKDQQFQLDLFEEKAINLITPIKKEKGQSRLTLFQAANNSIHSSRRQTIDTLFGWIDDKTGIQDASKVRSVDGLFCHVCLKMLAALILLIVKF